MLCSMLCVLSVKCGMCCILDVMFDLRSGVRNGWYMLCSDFMSCTS